jgi:uncharacterized protein
MYDVNTDKIIKLPEIIYHNLHNDSNIIDCSDEIKNYISKIKEKGYMKSNRVEITEHPIDK